MKPNARNAKTKTVKQASPKLNISLATLVATITPWIAPLLTAIFVMAGINRHFGQEHLPYGIAMDAVSILAAAIIEFVGFSAAYTGLAILRWNTKESRAKKYLMWNEFIVVALCYAAYLGAVSALVFLLDIMPRYKDASKLMFVVLGAVGPLVVAVQDRFNAVKSAAHEPKTEEGKTATVLAHTAQKRSKAAVIFQTPKSPNVGEPGAKSDRFAIPVSGRTRAAAYRILAERAAIGDQMSGAELARIMKKGDSTGRRLKRELWPLVVKEMTGGNGHEPEN